MNLSIAICRLDCKDQNAIVEFSIFYDLFFITRGLLLHLSLVDLAFYSYRENKNSSQ